MSVFIGRVTENEPEGFVNIVLTEGEKPSRNFYPYMRLEATPKSDGIKLSIIGYVSILDSENITFLVDNPDKTRSLGIGDEVLIKIEVRV